MPSLDSLIQQTLDTAANKGAQMKNYRDMMLRDATDKWRAELEGRANVARMGEEGAIKRADMQYGLGGASDRANAAGIQGHQIQSASQKYASDITSAGQKSLSDIHKADREATAKWKDQELRLKRAELYGTQKETIRDPTTGEWKTVVTMNPGNGASLGQKFAPMEGDVPVVEPPSKFDLTKELPSLTAAALKNPIAAAEAIKKADPEMPNALVHDLLQRSGAPGKQASAALLQYMPLTVVPQAVEERPEKFPDQSPVLEEKRVFGNWGRPIRREDYGLSLPRR
jgi:hypothetical protein